MNLKVLFVEDNENLRKDLLKIFDNEIIFGHTLIAEGVATFEMGIDAIKKNDYDLVVLDLYKGDPIEGNEKLGLSVLAAIQQTVFIPVIFFSGLTKDLKGIESEIVGVVNKGDGIEALRSKIEGIITSSIGIIKRKVYEHIRISLRDYFWQTVHEDKAMIDPIKNDISLGYLLLRRIANSLSKENIKNLLGDDKIQTDKAHPMEFYIFPSESTEFESGEIISDNKNVFVILTPSCDFLPRKKKDVVERKVGKVLLSKVAPLNQFPQYKDFIENDSKENTNKLSSLISNNLSDRYFFLPGTPFISNGIIDFQNKVMVEYEELKNFTRIAKLDDPFAQSMISSFIRYYNRVGFPDIDVQFILNSLKPKS